eukprot:scaffold770_cov109-Cylindrotheca_fusiformis.AAC.6
MTGCVFILIVLFRHHRSQTLSPNQRSEDDMELRKTLLVKAFLHLNDEKALEEDAQSNSDNLDNYAFDLSGDDGLTVSFRNDDLYYDVKEETKPRQQMPLVKSSGALEQLLSTPVPAAKAWSRKEREKGLSASEHCRPLSSSTPDLRGLKSLFSSSGHTKSSKSRKASGNATWALERPSGLEPQKKLAKGRSELSLSLLCEQGRSNESSRTEQEWFGDHSRLSSDSEHAGRRKRGDSTGGTCSWVLSPETRKQGKLKKKSSIKKSSSARNKGLMLSEHNGRRARSCRNLNEGLANKDEDSLSHSGHSCRRTLLTGSKSMSMTDLETKSTSLGSSSDRHSTRTKSPKSTKAGCRKLSSSDNLRGDDVAVKSLVSEHGRSARSKKKTMRVEKGGALAGIDAFFETDSMKQSSSARNKGLMLSEHDGRRARSCRNLNEGLANKDEDSLSHSGHSRRRTLLKGSKSMSMTDLETKSANLGSSSDRHSTRTKSPKSKKTRCRKSSSSDNLRKKGDDNRCKTFGVSANLEKDTLAATLSKVEHRKKSKGKENVTG